MPVALFFPRGGGVVVAVAFPETEPVVLDPFEPLQPLRAFPRVALGDDEPERSAMIRRQVGAVVAVGDQDIVIGQDLDGEARRVAGVAMRDDVVGVAAWLGER